MPEGIDTMDQSSSDDRLRCYQSSLIGVSDLLPEELFGGFDEIRIITFSYDVQMTAALLKHFKYAEIIFGADFMVKKDHKTADLVARVLAAADDTAKRVGAVDSLVKMVSDGNLAVRSSVNILDHRKLYLMRADDGKTRVVVTSANMTRKAWSMNQMETYTYYDDKAAYESFRAEFETAWNMAVDLPYEVLSVKETDDPLKANAIIKKVEETSNAVILQMPQEEEKTVLSNYQYAIDLNRAEESYKALVANTGLRSKDGLIQITAKNIEKLKVNWKKAKIRKADIETVTEGYPKLVIDYDNQQIVLNGKPADMHPSEDEVHKDLNVLDMMFAKYNAFVCKDTEKQKEIYYKLLNAMFASPFFAKLRCDARLVNVGTNSLPLYCLVSSSHSSTGKTLFIEAVMKMMTGKKDLGALSPRMVKPSDAVSLQASGCGVPYFVDEIDGSYLANLKKSIKTVESICDVPQKDHVPMLLLASNDLTDPETQLRKRMIFLDPEGTIPEDADQNAWKSAGLKMINGFGTGLYREFCRRMIPKIWKMIDMMETNGGRDLPETWYPDALAVSSETLIEILKDYGYDVPSFVRPLTWKDDYSENADYVTENALDEIRDVYKMSRKSFSVNGDLVSIKLGGGNRKMAESWKAVLPAELLKNVLYSREGYTIILFRKPLEERLGFKIRRRLF